MSTTEPTVDITWSGTCRQCRTEWDFYDDDLRAGFPAMPPEASQAEAITVRCSCGADLELTRLDVTTFPFAAWDVLPPAGGCPECGADHEPEMPHDLGSLSYLYGFRSREAKAGREERWPTWLDAMAHCTPEMREIWIAAMGDLGHILNEDGTVTVLDEEKDDQA